jgi:hypothetical protein
MFSRFPYNRQLTELYLFPRLQTLAAAETANDDAAVKAAEEHAEAARAKDDAKAE